MKGRKKNALTCAMECIWITPGELAKSDKSDEESYNTYDEITERTVPYVKNLDLPTWNWCR